VGGTAQVGLQSCDRREAPRADNATNILQVKGEERVKYRSFDWGASHEGDGLGSRTREGL
jgi:hypothetical protein